VIYLHINFIRFLIILGSVVIVSIPLLLGLHYKFHKTAEEHDKEAPRIFHWYFGLLFIITYIVWALGVDHQPWEEIVSFLTLFIIAMVITATISTLIRRYFKSRRENL